MAQTNCVRNYADLSVLPNSHVIVQQPDGTFGYKGSDGAWRNDPLMGIFAAGAKNEEFQRKNGYDPRKCPTLIFCYGCPNCEPIAKL